MRVQVCCRPLFVCFVLVFSVLLFPQFVTSHLSISDRGRLNMVVDGNCIGIGPCPSTRLSGFVITDPARYDRHQSSDSSLCSVGEIDFHSLSPDQSSNVILFISAGECSIEQKYRNAIEMGLKGLIVVGQSAADGLNSTRAFFPGQTCLSTVNLPIYHFPHHTINMIASQTSFLGADRNGFFGSMISNQVGCYFNASSTSSDREGQLNSSDENDSTSSSNRRTTAIIVESILGFFIFVLLSRCLYVRYRRRRLASGEVGIGGDGLNMDQYRDLSGSEDTELAAGFAADAEHHRSFWSRSIAEPTAPEL